MEIYLLRGTCSNQIKPWPNCCPPLLDHTQSCLACTIFSGPTVHFIDIKPENLAKGTSSHCIHGARLQVNQNSLQRGQSINNIKLQLYPWDIFATRSLIVVDIDPFQLDLGAFSAIRAVGLNPMLIAETFPFKSLRLSRHCCCTLLSPRTLTRSGCRTGQPGRAQSHAFSTNRSISETR